MDFSVRFPRMTTIEARRWWLSSAFVVTALGCSAEQPGSEVPPPSTSGPVVPAAPSATSSVHLFGAPLVFNPTSNQFGIHVVARSGDVSSLRALVRKAGGGEYQAPSAPSHPADDVAQWLVDGLEPGTRYEYRIEAPALLGTQTEIVFEGSATTQRPRGESFSFTIIADTHVPQATDLAQSRALIEATYSAVMSDVAAFEAPDFIVNLGDMLDFHLYGFNKPPLVPEGSRDAYMNYRSLMGPLLGNAAHFPVIGNWEGENGCFTDEVIDRSRSQRLRYLPAPEPTTYPEGGSDNEDYYAFQWGDALFVVLNVMTYTETCHDLTLASDEDGRPEDWTLGSEQLAWLQKTLDEATSKWRFVLVHHVVGGAGGDAENAAYGRGGGLSAYIGEQALVHEMMQEAGVQIFFYGHDHVFTDMVVDGIHYTLPGSAGAPWKFDTYDTGYVNYWPDSGYGRVNVSPEMVQVDFIAQGGTLLYSYHIPDPDHQSLNVPPARP